MHRHARCEEPCIYGRDEGEGGAGADRVGEGADGLGVEPSNSGTTASGGIDADADAGYEGEDADGGDDGDAPEAGLVRGCDEP